MRAAITIIYNGLHHLKSRGFAEFMTDNFDLWIVVEGSSKNGGSTDWCKAIKTDHRSTDGTLEYLREIELAHDNVIVYSHHKHYTSKDEQFNKGIALLKTKTTACFLWQVDADEHWNVEDIRRAERTLWKSASNVACFGFNHYVKELDDQMIIARGDWGGGTVNRLWKWRGQMFEKHEPAVMMGQKPPLVMPYKFEHYSLTHECDVRFKSKFYKAHEMLYVNWKNLDNMTYPVHIKSLFGSGSHIGRSNTYLHKITKPCVNVTSLESQKSDLTC